MPHASFSVSENAAPPPSFDEKQRLNSNCVADCALLIKSFELENCVADCVLLIKSFSGYICSAHVIFAVHIYRIEKYDMMQPFITAHMLYLQVESP
jgi:hypothetical protein